MKVHKWEEFKKSRKSQKQGLMLGQNVLRPRQGKLQE
jgi:hypothetical protein